MPLTHRVLSSGSGAADSPQKPNPPRGAVCGSGALSSALLKRALTRSIPSAAVFCLPCPANGLTPAPHFTPGAGACLPVLLSCPPACGKRATEPLTARNTSPSPPGKERRHVLPDPPHVYRRPA
ncbi:hypothetical protein X965_11295 [Morganella sp. EGD-HP17]|nr:hypothetical protein X965_11295 [Morganella sp. EGD-HP17]